MLPSSYQLPAVLLLVVGGVLACFAGYRLFRVVLAIYGFILGAMLASSVMGISNTAGMIAAALVGGIVGALVLTLAYFAGIALVGAGLGALVAHLFWTYSSSAATAATPGASDPPAIAVIVLSILGAIVAMLLQRYVIILGTAFGGAWTLIVGGLALMGNREAARAASTGNVWILYPFDPAPGHQWIVFAWLTLGVIGAVVQIGVTGTRKR